MSLGSSIVVVTLPMIAVPAALGETLAAKVYPIECLRNNEEFASKAKLSAADVTSLALLLSEIGSADARLLNKKVRLRWVKGLNAATRLNRDLAPVIKIKRGLFGAL